MNLIDRLLLNVQSVVFQLYSGREQVNNNNNNNKMRKEWSTGAKTVDCH